MGAEAHPPAKRGKWPVPHAHCVAVLYRIEVDVIEVPRKIVRVAQRMCSQYRRCQIPRSALAGRLAEIGSPEGKAREKPLLIRLQRVVKKRPVFPAPSVAVSGDMEPILSEIALALKPNAGGGERATFSSRSPSRVAV